MTLLSCKRKPTGMSRTINFFYETFKTSPKLHSLLPQFLTPCKPTSVISIPFLGSISALPVTLL